MNDILTKQLGREVTSALIKHHKEQNTTFTRQDLLRALYIRGPKTYIGSLIALTDGLIQEFLKNNQITRVSRARYKAK